MKIGAGVVGILLGIYSLAYVGLFGGLVGGAAGWVGATFGPPGNNDVSSWAQTVQVLSWLCPVSALIGAIITFSYGGVGGTILIVSAGLHWQLLGFGAIGNLYIYSLGATGLLAVIAGILDEGKKIQAGLALRPSVLPVMPTAFEAEKLGGGAPTVAPIPRGPSLGEQAVACIGKIRCGVRDWWRARSQIGKRRLIAATVVAALALVGLTLWAVLGPFAIEVFGIKSADLANSAIDVAGTVCANNDLASAGVSAIPLRDGTYAIETPSPYTFAILGNVAYGNVSGDLGRGEPDHAAFMARCVQSGNATDVLFIYGAVHGAAARLATYPFGREVSGGSENFTVNNGTMRFVQSEGEMPCCATGTRTSTFVWVGNDLRVVSTSVETTVPDVALPGNPEAESIVEAAVAAAQTNDCATAEGDLTRALAVDPLNPTANYYHAYCRVEAGDVPGAVLPLRLAAQYGANDPEGQLARNLAKELADRTSPSQGIDDGCAIPVMPPPINPGDDVAAAKARAILFFRASGRFHNCVVETAKNLRARLQMSERLANKLAGPLLRNGQEAQMVSDQIEAAARAHAARFH